MEYLSSPDIILFIQRIANPILDKIFMGITRLGNEEFYLLCIPILYWCVEKKFAFKLGMVFLLSAYVNDLLKTIFTTERPSPEVVRVLYPESGGGYAFPSGHSQNSAVFWGVCAWQIRKAWAWIVAVILVLLIGVSRLYLGVHWPIDVLGGWIIGIVILGIYILYDAKIIYRKAFDRVIPQIIFVLAIGTALYFINSSDTSVRVIGAFVGLAIGYILEEKYINFEPRSVWWYQIIKLVVGVAVLVVIKIFVKKLLPEALEFDLIRYALIGFWISLGVPFFFRGRKR